MLGRDEKVRRDLPVCWAKTAIRDRKILFSPCNGSEFYLYEEESDRLQRIEVLHDISGEDNATRFWETVVVDRDFYVMGLCYPGIVKINADTREVIYLSDSVKDFYTESDSADGNFYFLDGHAQYAEELYLPTGVDSSLLHMNCENDSCELVRLNCGIEKIWSISQDGDDIWMSDLDPETGKIAIWNRVTNVIRRMTLPKKGLWYAPVFHDGYAFFFPITDEAAVYRVNTANLQFEVFDRLDVLFQNSEKLRQELSLDKKDKRKRVANVLMVQKDESKITFIRRPDFTWFTYDLETDELKKKQYRIDDEVYLAEMTKAHYDYIFDTAGDHNGICPEEQMPLDEFLSRVRDNN